METLYWITVLGNLYALSGYILAILIVTILSLGTYVLATLADYAYEKDKARARMCCKKIKKLALCSIIPILILTFVPSIKQLYAIYGVGTVIDAKENKEIQKLPDSAVKALNIWLENISKEEKDSTNSD